MPKVVDHEARRQELLAACEELFAARGYDGLGMRRLARELGVSTGTLYHYFPSKEAIFDALLAWAVLRDVQGVMGELPQEAPQAERIRALREYLLGPGATGTRRTLLLAIDLRRSREDAEADALLSQTLHGYQQALATELGLDSDAVEELFTVLLGVLVRSTLVPDWDAAPLLTRALARLPDHRD